MKNKLLLVVLVLFTTSMYSQNINKFNIDDINIGVEKFKSENNYIKIDIKPHNVVSIKVDASKIDTDYKYITYIFIADKIVDCIIEFNTEPTIDLLKSKYGEYTITKIGYEWNDRKFKIIYNKDIMWNEVTIFTNR